MNEPLVSIIVPCYRQANYLPGTLRSALAQTYSAIEVIVVNDGSDDDTEAVAKQFGDRIVYIWQQNAGLPAARNTGIHAASGKYLLFLDSDDLLHPNAVAWLAAAANGREDVLCAMGSRFFETESDLETGFERMPPAPERFAAALMRGNPGPPHSYMTSRAMMLQIAGFDRSLKSCEDWDAWARLLFSGVSIATVRHIGALYRQHPASMSRNALRMAQTATEVVKRNLHRMEGSPQRLMRLGCDADLARKHAVDRLVEEYLNAGYYHRLNGDFGSATRCYRDAIAVGGLRAESVRAMIKLFYHRAIWELKRFRFRSGAPTLPRAES